MAQKVNANFLSTVTAFLGGEFWLLLCHVRYLWASSSFKCANNSGYVAYCIYRNILLGFFSPTNHRSYKLVDDAFILASCGLLCSFYGFLAHLYQSLRWTFFLKSEFACCMLLSLSSLLLNTFHLLQNHKGNFNQNLHKVFFG